MSTALILLIAAVAGVGAYFGVPSGPSPNYTSTAPHLVTVSIPSGANSSSSGYQPPALTLQVGANNTLVFTDEGNSGSRSVVSVAVPTGAAQWDFQNMIQDKGYLVTLTVPGTYTYVIYMPYAVVGTVLVV